MSPTRLRLQRWPLLFAAMLTLSVPRLYGQEGTTSAPSQRHFSCQVPGCGFAVQGSDSAEIGLVVSAHMLYDHNQKMDGSAVWSSAVLGPLTVRGGKLWTAACPFGDGFALWSRQESEVRLWMGAHVQLAHGKTLSGGELDKLIKQASGE